MFKRILHANDGSDHAFEALALAFRMAREGGCELENQPWSRSWIRCKEAFDPAWR